jgi:hypothetical protein
MIIFYHLQKANHYFLPSPLAHKVLGHIAFKATSPSLGKPIVLFHTSMIANLTIELANLAFQ